MKKILLNIFLPLLLTGCVNLDFVESSSLTSAALADNPAAAVYTTDGIYAMMKDMVEFRGVISDQNTFVRRYFMMSEIKSDNICFSNTSTDAFWTSATYMDDENSSDAAYLWLICYKAIYAANANISGLAEDTAQNRQLKGENHFLRAFFHFTLCDFFAKPYTLGAGADNPGVILRIGSEYDPNPVRASLGDCYTAIEKDLLEAIRLMDPASVRGNNGYARKESAQALLARLYLYKGEWQNCIDICNDLIGPDASAVLESEVTTLFSTAPMSKEVLWCVNITDGDMAGFNPKSLIASMYDSPDGTQGTGWGELYVSDPLLDLFERYPQDKRYKDLIRLHNSTPGLMVTWGELDNVNNCLAQVLALPGVNVETGELTSCVTDNGDGTYSFTYDGKQYVAIPDNTSTKISDEFPGYILQGTNTRCYVREVMPTPTITSTGGVIWENNGLSIRPGGYPTWFSEKFSHQQGSAFPLTTSYIMLRMGEVVLNRAEAYAHLGGHDAEALADVNAIRARAGLTGDAQMTLTNMNSRGYATVLDAVLDERRMELYYEGFRVLDLVRNKKGIDRRFPSRAECEVISYDDPRIQYQIPIDETSITGIAKNVR